MLLASCASPARLRAENISKSAGNYQIAIENIEKNKKDLYNSEDSFLFEFDLGVLHHYSQNYSESIKHFAKAEQILEDLYSRSVTNEAVALLTNDNIRPYRSYPFEIQWLYQTQILNYLALGEIDEAVVEARRALLAIQALRESEKNKFNESGTLQYLIAISYEWQKSEDDARIAYNDAKRNFESSGYTPKLAAQVPQNEQEIIVIGYAGMSPILGENKFWGTYAKDGALFLHYRDANGQSQTILLSALGLGGGGFSGGTVTIQFAIPKMVERASQNGVFAVNVNGNTQSAEIFSNTKNSIQKDLENGQTTMLIRTAGRVILRTIAANKAKEKMRTGNGIADLVLNLGADFATGAMENADLRLGSALPQTIQILRIPVEPGEHLVKIDILDKYGRKTGSFAEQAVKVKKGGKVFIFAPALK
jgi:tetratricopeptide (TPR) repeat protein